MDDPLPKSNVENVVVDEYGEVDYYDHSITQNSRVSYPIYNINKIVLPSKAGHASNIIYLSADAFGVLPPVSVLDDAQAQYHFLCGFTSKLAGTERGITEPQPSFSPAFGEAFLTLKPTMYSSTLVAKMKEHDAKAYLVNTGWNGTGKRISLKDTRAIIDSILDVSIDGVETVHVPYLNLNAPKALSGVSNILDPRNTYKDVKQWEEKAKKLAEQGIDVEVKVTKVFNYIPNVLYRLKEKRKKYPSLYQPDWVIIYINDKKTRDYVFAGTYKWNGKTYVTKDWSLEIDREFLANYEGANN